MSKLSPSHSTSDVEKDGMKNDPTLHSGAVNDWPIHDDPTLEDSISHEQEDTSPTGEPIGAGLEKTTSARSQRITRIVTGRSAASSWKDPGPPPDGGVVAWTQAGLSHLTLFSTWGYVSSFGAFQTYYAKTLNVSNSTISWLGSVQIFLLFFIGTFSGRALDAGLFRHVYLAGAALQLLGIFSQSFATQYWQLFLSQALCLGLANGLQFCPSVGLVSTYFAKRRSFAIGLTALGSCTGGIVFPIIVQQCIPKLGFPWTVRIVGFVMLATNLLTFAFYRTRLPPRKAGPLVELAAFKEPTYVLYLAGMFFNFWGLYFAFFYVGLFAREVLGVSYQSSVNLLLTMVATGFIFRLLPSYFADKVGPLNTMIPFAITASVMMFAWIGIKSLGTLYVFAVIYGAGSAGLQSLFPAALSSLTVDLRKAGTRLGMGFSIVSFACLSGTPLAGALIQRAGGSYKYAQIWAGLSFALGSSLLVAARVSKVGWKFKAKV